MTITPVKFEDCVQCGHIRYNGAQRDSQRGDVLLIRSRRPNKDTELIISMTFPVAKDIQRVLAKSKHERDCIDEDMIEAHTEYLSSRGYVNPLAMFLEDFLESCDGQVRGHWFSAHGYCQFQKPFPANDAEVKRFLAIYPNEGSLDGGEVARQMEFAARRCENGPLIDFDAFFLEGTFVLAETA